MNPQEAPNLWMVFDCESIGIHGETFAVGWVVVRRDGTLVAEGKLACSPTEAAGGDEGRKWIAEHCPPLPDTCLIPAEVRRLFWNAWLEFQAQGAVLVADCAWPVEARFLIACVDDDPDTRTWQGPYPFVDVSSLRLAAGMDPMATYERLPDEPQHDPLGDARQSARLLVMALGKLEEGARG